MTTNRLIRRVEQQESAIRDFPGPYTVQAYVEWANWKFPKNGGPRYKVGVQIDQNTGERTAVIMDAVEARFEQSARRSQ